MPGGFSTAPYMCDSCIELRGAEIDPTQSASNLGNDMSSTSSEDSHVKSAFSDTSETSFKGYEITSIPSTAPPIGSTRNYDQLEAKLAEVLKELQLTKNQNKKLLDSNNQLQDKVHELFAKTNHTHRDFSLTDSILNIGPRARPHQRSLSTESRSKRRRSSNTSVGETVETFADLTLIDDVISNLYNNEKVNSTMIEVQPKRDNNIDMEKLISTITTQILKSLSSKIDKRMNDIDGYYRAQFKKLNDGRINSKPRAQQNNRPVSQQRQRSREHKPRKQQQPPTTLNPPANAGNKGQNPKKNPNKEQRPTSTNARARSRSKAPGSQSGGWTAVTNKKSKVAKKADDKSTNSNLPLAAIIAQAKKSPEFTRNVKINTEKQNVAERLLADKVIEKIGFLRVIVRSERLIVFVADSEEKVKALDEIIEKCYDGAAISAPAPAPLNMILITGTLQTMGDTQNDICESLRVNNPWLERVSYVRHWDVNGKNSKYRNIIVAVSTKDQATLINKGQVMFRMRMHRCYEYNDLMQCRNCWRYGHYRHSCRYPQACKVCGGDHDAAVCTTKSDKCVNCIRYNKTKASEGQKRKTTHKPTDKRCPDFLQRLSGLKKFWES